MLPLERALLQSCGKANRGVLGSLDSGELPLHCHRQGSFGSHSVLGFLQSREAL